MSALLNLHIDNEPMAASRRVVLDHAARLFRQYGYAAVSMRDIAAACGIKAGSLYYHFPSKEQIVLEVLDAGVGTVFDTVRSAAAALPPDAGLAVRLRSAIGAHLHALLELGDYTGANIRIFGHVPEHVRTAAMATRRLYEEWWTRLLEQGAAEGAFAPGTDLKLTKLFLLGAMNWSLTWYKSGADRHDVQAIADHLAGLVLHGVAAPTAKPRARPGAAAASQPGSTPGSKPSRPARRPRPPA
ncbi:MAG: TetR/AcrR family transcriptional regulator [Janthinobacterium lividum]